MLVPEFVPGLVVGIYPQALIAGILVAIIGLTGIAFQKNDLGVLILTDIAGIGMLVIVAAVATDLAEALILPGLVVELAEIMAISEILISREMRKSKKTSKELAAAPFSMNMEILDTAPIFLAIILVAYGAFLTGFTGGAVAGVGILFYVLSRTFRGLPTSLWEGISGVSGVAWCLWIGGFLLFFIVPPLWLLALFLAAFGILLKVASKAGLIGVMGREEFKRE